MLKILFVSLLVLGLFYQPSQGERLSQRIAGGFVAQPGQFPFAIMFTYTYTSGTSTFTYRGTGVLYNDDLVVTTANALDLCVQQSSSATFYLGVTDVNKLDGIPSITVPCTLNTVVSQPSTFASGVYFNDKATVNLAPAKFKGVGGLTLRGATSSPTADDIDNLYVLGYGETVPEGPPSPVLLYVPINPMTNHKCFLGMQAKGLENKISFTENFCVKGFFDNQQTKTGLTDACTLDAGAPIIRTSDIRNPQADFEVVGIVNFATCSVSTPVIATYLFKYSLPVQRKKPSPANPPNPFAANKNFACGDGIRQRPYEDCDPPSDRTNPFFCCNPWTCKNVGNGALCTINNRNGTVCRTQPICTDGKCATEIRAQGKECYVDGVKRVCNKGLCCVPKTTARATDCAEADS